MGRLPRRPEWHLPLERLEPTADGSGVRVRLGGRTLGTVEPGVPAALGLRVGELVPPQVQSALERALAERAACDAGVGMLARRPYSAAQLERALRLRHGTDAAAAAMVRLRVYLDDEAFARTWAESRLRAGPRGAGVLTAGLRQAGVTRRQATAAVDVALEAAGGEPALCAAAARRWVARHGQPEGRAAVARLWAHLARRGFSGDVIARALAGTALETME